VFVIREGKTLCHNPDAPCLFLGERMGSFNTSCIVQNHSERHRMVAIPRILVDTGSGHTWIPASALESIGIVPEEKLLYLILANGQRVSRHIGFAIVRVGERSTTDEVVFAEEGDLILLGARTMEGLNLAVDPVEKKLVDRGPIPAACSPAGAP
jgi:predicted aspartyl protease